MIKPILRLNDALDFGPYQRKTIRWVIDHYMYYIEILSQEGWLLSKATQTYLKKKQTEIHSPLWRFYK